jgi:hypothetical protein
MFRQLGWRGFPIAGVETRQLPLKTPPFDKKMAEISVWHGS